MMRRVAIVQARMTSTRLPGKVLADLSGAPLLAREIERLRRCRSLDGIVVATTTNRADDPVVELATRLGVDVHRGSEHDVLSRYVEAARQARADVVVRVTADCPLVDAPHVDRVVDALVDGASECDYTSNTLEPSVPRGLDAEALFTDVLERVHRLARSAPAREHVTHFILEERPDLFVRRSVRDAEDHSDLRLTVDTAEDLALVRRVFADLRLGERDAPYAEVVSYLRAHPDVRALNAHVKQKPPA